MTVRGITEKIIDFRERKRKYTQTYMAHRLGMTQKAYSKIETGETKLTVHHLLQIADILEIEMHELLDVGNNAIYHNHNTHNGEGIVMTKNISTDSKELYEKLLDARDKEIEYLRGLLTQFVSGKS